MKEKGDKSVIIIFEDWRTVADVQMPFVVLIDDGSRRFEFRFKEINFNKETLSSLKAPINLLSEGQKLLRMHRMIMDDHLYETTTNMKEFQGDSVIIVSEGEIFKMMGRESIASLNQMFANRDYTIYDDLIRPIIKVSPDKKLGWVIAKLHAEGFRKDSNGVRGESLKFTCSWIELYEKPQDEWKFIGIVSNFLPDQK